MTATNSASGNPPTLVHSVICFFLVIVSSIVSALLFVLLFGSTSDLEDENTLAYLTLLDQGTTLLVLLGVIGFAGLNARGSLRLRRIHSSKLLVGILGIIALSAIVINALYLIDSQMTINQLDRFGSEPINLDNVHNAIIQLLGVVIMAGVVEELAFRGLILRGLQSAMGGSVAAVLSSLGFAAMHPAAMPFIWSFLLGLFLAFITLQTGSIFPAIGAHAANNLWGTVAGRFLEIESLPYSHWLLLSCALILIVTVWRFNTDSDRPSGLWRDESIGESQ